MLSQILRLSSGTDVSVSKNIAMAIADAITVLIPNLCVFLIISEMLAPVPRYQNLVIYCVLILVSLLMRLVSIRSAFVAHSLFSSQSGYQMRVEMISKLTKVPLGDLLGMDIGKINNTLLKDVEFTEHTLSHVVSYLLGIGCVLLMLTIWLMFIEWRLALSMLVGFPLAIFMFLLFSKLSQQHKHQLYESSDKLNDAILDYIKGIRTLRAYQQAKGEILELESKVKQSRDCHLKYELGASLAPAAFVVCSEVGFATLILFGVYGISVQSVSIEVFLFFLLVSMQFYRPLTHMAILLSQLQHFRVSMRRIENLLDKQELVTATQTASTTPCRDVVFDNVDFSYNQNSIFKQLSLTFPARSVTALVGPSGSGKSSVLNLIARFWDVDEGAVTIAGQNVKSMQFCDMFEQVSMVFQDVYLFDDSIYHNLTLGQDVSEAQIEQACRQAQCWQLIQSLPEGLHTRVGEGGAKLSGGEKQRLSIARALLKDTPVILLDEATAALDCENEALIQQAITHLVKDKTVIVVAHNLLSVTKADNIVVLDNGKVESQGTHTQLLEQSKIYQALWNDQLQVQGWRA